MEGSERAKRFKASQVAQRRDEDQILGKRKWAGQTQKDRWGAASFETPNKAQYATKIPKIHSQRGPQESPIANAPWWRFGANWQLRGAMRGVSSQAEHVLSGRASLAPNKAIAEEAMIVLAA